MTTRYQEGDLLSVIAAMHEFGHALYERQIAPELSRTNLGGGTSMSVHESQSKLWENHVGRHPAFAGVLAEAFAAGGFAVEPAALHASLVAVRPSLIRVSADPVSYPLHIVLRFELELALIEGGLEVPDLPAAWNDGTRRLLGIEVPDDAAGVLQDTHWAARRVRLLPVLRARLPDRRPAVGGARGATSARRTRRSAAGDVTAIRDWLVPSRPRPRPPARHRAAGRARHRARDGGGAVPAARALLVGWCSAGERQRRLGREGEGSTGRGWGPLTGL